MSSKYITSLYKTTAGYRHEIREVGTGKLIGKRVSKGHQYKQAAVVQEIRERVLVTKEMYLKEARIHLDNCKVIVQGTPEAIDSLKLGTFGKTSLLRNLNTKGREAFIETYRQEIERVEARVAKLEKEIAELPAQEDLPVFVLSYSNTGKFSYLDKHHLVEIVKFELGTLRKP